MVPADCLVSPSKAGRQDNGDATALRHLLLAVGHLVSICGHHPRMESGGTVKVESPLKVQRRFKRAGQFWTPRGLRHWAPLHEARRNHHWDEL